MEEMGPPGVPAKPASCAHIGRLSFFFFFFAVWLLPGRVKNKINLGALKVAVWERSGLQGFPGWG